ncbi:MAG: TonB-dependent receptor plug domain-containing protein [Luteitalea sp.]|nr:TonB-dependent receptor plug domain-containing protein [Luteitalea sp.]
MRLCGALLLVLAVASPVTSQVRTVGAIAGTVVDASGAVVPGASVHLRDELTNSERETVSNEQGAFQLLDLQAGSYEVTVALEGFRSTVYSGVAVESARTTDLNVRLEVGALGEDVVVTGAAPTLETTSSTLSTTVTNDDLQNLPLSGRNVLNFALLVPGVQSSSAANARESTYQGMPGATINITIDGINNNSQGFKSGGTSFFATVPPRLDAIEEVSVSTGGLGADTGAEGAMNIRFVTRRGTNAFRGGTFFQYRHDSLNANDYFNNARDVEKPRDRRNEFGGHLGGPILRDKAFFFFNWEEARVPRQEIQTRTVLTEEARQGVYRYQGTDGVERTANLLDIARSNGFSGTVDPIIGSQLATIDGTAENAALTSTDLLRNELRWNESRTTIEHYPTVRVDYHLTPSLAVNGALNLFDRDIDGRRQFPGDLTPLQVFGNTWLIGSSSMNWTISPTTLMEIRYGLQRNSDTFNRGELIDQFDIGGRRALRAADGPRLRDQRKPRR